MGIPVNLDELLTALEWVSAGDVAAVECEAIVSRTTGRVHWRGEGVDEALPDDIEDGSLYIEVPHKTEFDLGRSLALRFVEDHLPAELATVQGFFRKRGAYGKFKSLLDRAGLLDAWHQYEQAAIETALRDWCEAHGLTPVVP